MKTKSNNKDKTIKIKDWEVHTKNGDIHWPEKNGGGMIATAPQAKAVVDRVKELAAKGKTPTLRISYDTLEVEFDTVEQLVTIGCQNFTFKEILDIGKKLGLK